MCINRIILAVTLIFISCPFFVSSQGIEMQSFDAFIKIYHQLRNDQMPTEAQWQELWTTPGYAYLEKTEKKSVYLQKWLPIILMPSKKAELEKAMSEINGYEKILLDHLASLPKEEEDLMKFANAIRTDQQIMTQILAMAQQYLPPGRTQEKEPPNISFAIFEPDGKASSERIVVDLLFAKNIDITAFLAHEAHHYFIPSNLNSPEESHPDYYLIRAIKQLRLEGIADLIDKQEILQKSNPNWYEEKYQKHYHESPQIFAEVDQDLQAFADQASSETAKQLWRKLPFGAHPNGLYMADLILTEYGRVGILECLANPFTFIKKYQKIALTDPDIYAFSQKAMQLLKSLEQKYIQSSKLRNFDELQEAEVMIVGSNHFGKEVLSEENQIEIQKIVDRIAEYNPTKVVVEKRAILQDSFSKTYQQFLKGKFDISKKPNEIFQLGYRLAQKLDHEDIYLFDDQTEFIGSLKNFSFDGFMKYADEHDKGFYDRHMEALTEIWNQNQAYQKSLKLYDYYVSINSEAASKINAQRMHLLENRVGVQKTWIGSDWLGRWYRRNIRMESIVLSFTEAGDRILIIVGDNHKWVLEQLFENTPEYKVVPSSKYLK